MQSGVSRQTQQQCHYCSKASVTPLQEAQQRVREAYEFLWSRWYSNFAHLKPASLTLNVADADSGYRPNNDEIVINLPESNWADVCATWHMGNTLVRAHR